MKELINKLLCFHNEGITREGYDHLYTYYWHGCVAYLKTEKRLLKPDIEADQR